MARTTKTGLDYFPLDVDFLQDRKIRRLMRRHGATAASAMIAAYSFIYREKGYYLPWDEDTCFDLSELAGTQASELQTIIDDALQAGIFHKQMYEQYRILTSEAIQKQYKQCTTKRKATDIEENYRLAQTETETEPSGINAPQTLFSATEIQQRKEKEKERKQKENKKEKENLPSIPSSNGGEKEDGNDIPLYCLNKQTHNYHGLLERLKALGVTDPHELNCIMRLSDYGRMGGAVWRIIVYGNWPTGKEIKAPGKYIIACLRKK